MGTSETKSEKVYRIFEEISQNYDEANERISAGQHQKWKKELVSHVIRHTCGEGSVLDLCCGTGDIALALARDCPHLSLTGVDFSPSMLSVAKKKSAGERNVTWIQADAMKLPFEDGIFSSAVISFGLRNTPDYGQVMSEMARVTRPGGLVCCMDASMPDSPAVLPFFKLYFGKVMPVLGGGKDKMADYIWLHDSTEQFLSKKQLCDLFRDVGLQNVTYRSFMFGSCALHTGIKKPSCAAGREAGKPQ